jgi:hypothetical protein
MGILAGVLFLYLLIILFFWGTFAAKIKRYQDPEINRNKNALTVLFNMVLAPFTMYGAIKNLSESFVDVDVRLKDLREALFSLGELNIGKARKIISQILDGK